MELYSTILILLFVYGAGLGIYQSFAFLWDLSRVYYTMIYFAAVSIALFGYVFYTGFLDISIFYFGFSPLSYVALGGLFFILGITPYILDEKSNNEETVLRLKKFNYPYVLGKTAEIVFQQTCIVLLTFLLFTAFQSVMETMFAYGALFGALHLPLYFIMERKTASIFFIGAIVSGIVMPPLILLVEGGVVYSFIVHWGFYLVFAYSLHFVKLSNHSVKRR